MYRNRFQSLFITHYFKNLFHCTKRNTESQLEMKKNTVCADTNKLFEYLWRALYVHRHNNIVQANFEFKKETHRLRTKINKLIPPLIESVWRYQTNEPSRVYKEP